MLCQLRSPPHPNPARPPAHLFLLSLQSCLMAHLTSHTLGLQPIVAASVSPSPAPTALHRLLAYVNSTPLLKKQLWLPSAYTSPHPNDKPTLLLQPSLHPVSHCAVLLCIFSKIGLLTCPALHLTCAHSLMLLIPLFSVST